MRAAVPWPAVIFLGCVAGILLCLISWVARWPRWAWGPDDDLDEPVDLYPVDDDEWRERLRRIHYEDELAADHWRYKKGIH